jgi:hypothetical protein
MSSRFRHRVPYLRYVPGVGVGARRFSRLSQRRLGRIPLPSDRLKPAFAGTIDQRGLWVILDTDLCQDPRGNHDVVSGSS